jgi:hypothetical protein
MSVSWPNGRRFAFTIFDDTDWATLANVRPIYDFLSDIGMRTTKSVWMFPGEGAQINGGATCEDKEYLDWLLHLNQLGFEIGLHNAAPSTSHREQTRLSLDRFGDLFGNRRIICCNHTGCLESIYWGDARLSGWRRLLYNILTRWRNHNIFRGHIEGDQLFWGDLCRERVGYVRNFVFDNVNTLKVCPEMPYHDPSKPFVNFWFASTDGGNLKRFLENFTLESIDRLEYEGGLCIGYVHFAASFVQDGRVDGEFLKRMKHIAGKDGWFAPVGEVLDFLRENAGPLDRVISLQRLRQIECRWLLSKIVKGTT